jgi:hypothetical protein
MVNLTTLAPQVTLFELAAERLHLLAGHLGFLFSCCLEQVLLGCVTIDSPMLLRGMAPRVLE